MKGEELRRHEQHFKEVNDALRANVERSRRQYAQILRDEAAEKAKQTEETK